VATLLLPPPRGRKSLLRAVLLRGTGPRTRVNATGRTSLRSLPGARRSPKGERAGEYAELRSCLCGPCFGARTMRSACGPLNFASDHSPDLRFPFKACARPGSAARVQASSGGGRVGRRLLIRPPRNLRKAAWRTPCATSGACVHAVLALGPLLMTYVVPLTLAGCGGRLSRQRRRRVAGRCGSWPSPHPVADDERADRRHAASPAAISRPRLSE
jgi:hypothetical protein